MKSFHSYRWMQGLAALAAGSWLLVAAPFPQDEAGGRGFPRNRDRFGRPEPRFGEEREGDPNSRPPMGGRRGPSGPGGMGMGNAMGDPVSQRLVQGIWREETEGDLAGAERLYLQAWQEFERVESAAALSLWRLAKCQEQMGKTEQAQQTLQTLQQRFAHLKEWRTASKGETPTPP